MPAITMDYAATPENFDEQAYLAANPDVAEAVARGELTSGKQHFDLWGKADNRRLRTPPDRIAAVQTAKIERTTPLLRLDLPYVRSGPKYDFLTEELRRETRIVDTAAVSSNPYPPEAEQLIDSAANGLVLDCGAGKRGVYYPNVVNYEIVNYDTTDIIGVGELLPFKDNSFDAVMSLAVLEHVRDPIRCAAELVRVLKSGGRLLCCAPFLVPVHGYPHHYFNMTPQGHKRLFEDSVEIETQGVPAYMLPIWWLAWALLTWADGLEGSCRQQFEDLRVGQLLGKPERFLNEPWVRGLSEAKNFELAAGTLIVARKP